MLRRREIAPQLVSSANAGAELAQHLDGAVCRVDQRRSPVGSAGEPARQTMRPPADADLRRNRCRAGRAASASGAAMSRRASRSAPGLAISADELFRRQEGVGRLPESPLRPAELGARADRAPLDAAGARVAAVQVPPAAAVGDEIQHAVGRPLRLEDRLRDRCPRRAGAPRATRRRRSRPATIRVPTQGMFGWSQAEPSEPCAPSGDKAGEA